MHQFGMEVRDFFLTDKPDIRRDCKLRAFKTAAELRKRVSNGTLEDFDALINPKLQLLMVQNEDASGDPVEGDIASEVPLKTDSKPRHVLMAAPDLYRAFYPEPDLPASIVDPDSLHTSGNPAPFASDEPIQPDQSFSSGDSFRFIFPDAGSLVTESRRRDAFLQHSEAVPPIRAATVSPSKPQSPALTHSQTARSQEIPDKSSDFHGFEQHAKQLFRGAADKWGVMVEALGKKVEQFGEQATDVFGMSSKSSEKTKSEVLVDLAIAITTDDAPGGWAAQSSGGKNSILIDQTGEFPRSADQNKKPEVRDEEVNPFELAQKDETEARQRFEEEVRELENLLLAAQKNAEALKKEQEPAKEAGGEAQSLNSESLTQHVTVPGSRSYEISNSESAIPYKEDLPATRATSVTSTAQPLRRSASNLKEKVHQKAKDVSKVVAHKTSVTWDKTADLRKKTAELGDDVATMGREAVSSGLEAGKAAAGWMAAHLGLK